ncbi:MAG TPA: TetR/AcrR family transcriptional regulator [Polyangiaceae bacterium]|nr:TetR/AcrR family transcriptional regulator [Polyangiaceae bacterium]
MPRAAFAQLPAERRRYILDVAAEEFARSGFAATSYNKLLERLGLGKSSAYYYFDNKRDLFVTVVVDCYERFFATAGEATPPKDADEFWRGTRALAVEGFEFMLRDPQSAAVMRCMQQDSALLAELTADEVLDSLVHYYRRLLVLGQALGAVRTDLPLDLLTQTTRAATLAFDQWFIQQPRSDALVQTSADYYLDVVRRLVEPAR